MKRADWHATQAEVEPHRLVFLDETSLRSDLTRLRGWAPGGERLVEAVPGGHWRSYTLVQAIALDGTRAAMVLEGALDGLSFTTFCEWLLAPSLQPGDLVVLDNLSGHYSQSALRAIEAVGASFVFLPPYSPDLNPIEKIFSKLKQLLRGHRPRTLRATVDALERVLQQITLDDIEAVYEHCGYAVAD